jgi:pimeloyl-ACP methyl ester carboxylesterase
LLDEDAFEYPVSISKKFTQENNMIFRLIFLSIVFNAAMASDFAKEQRWADQVVDFLMDGEAVWLDVENREILSIHTEPDEDSKKALIVMHGTGVHPNWNQVIQPLRVGMALRGWHTISIQMPVLPNEASHDDYAPLFVEAPPRIEAAIAYLQGLGVTDIVLAGHSLGSLMTSYYLSTSANDAVKGFVAIGMPGGSSHDQMNALKTLAGIELPILDLYGSMDLPEVLENTQARKLAAKGAAFEQIEVEGANHFFDNYEEALIDTVDDWLSRHF